MDWHACRRVSPVRRAVDAEATLPEASSVRLSLETQRVACPASLFLPPRPPLLPTAPRMDISKLYAPESPPAPAPCSQPPPPRLRSPSPVRPHDTLPAVSPVAPFVPLFPCSLSPHP